MEWLCDPEKISLFIGTTGERVSLARIAGVVYEAKEESGDIGLSDYVRVWGRGPLPA